MMPAKLLPRAVAMPADPFSQPLDLSRELLTCHDIKIFVHNRNYQGQIPDQAPLTFRNFSLPT